jgi:hypothetical protein
MINGLLMLAGCHGTDADEQSFDRAIPTEFDRVVWRLSVPSDGTWPDIPFALQRFVRLGLEVHCLVIVRDWLPCAKSQVLNNYVINETVAYHHQLRALWEILDALRIMKLPQTVVTYAGLIARPVEYMRWLTARLGLYMPDVEKVRDYVRDADAKHW